MKLFICVRVTWRVYAVSAGMTHGVIDMNM